MQTTDQRWARALVADIPHPWAGALLAAWDKRRAAFNPLVAEHEGIARRKANEQLRADVAKLHPLSPMLPLKSWDKTVRAHAWDMASQCRMVDAIMQARQAASFEDAALAIRAAGVAGFDLAALDLLERRQKIEHYTRVANVDGPAAKTASGAIARLVDVRWWTMKLRKAHAKAVEASAVRLGLVRRDRECYVSTLSVEHRQDQNARNAAALEGTIARNIELEQEFTLAQLAAKGTANKSIRRAELMTRINGFERIAIAAGHKGLFLTMTCPGNMHRMKTQGKRTIENRKWNGTLPDGAQAHLSAVWARVRAALDRRGVRLYGFRIAEPNHDGTPHWHFLVFHDPAWNPGWHAPLVWKETRAAQGRIAAMIRRYALEIPGLTDTVRNAKALACRLRARGWKWKRCNAVARALVSRDLVRVRAAENAQRGAKAKRVDIKIMDPAKGTAAGYIAKYVAKNIDGYRLEKDLYGNDIFETSARVEAWASRWNIRQFQQVGGAPVTVWRELRRVESVPGDAPAFVAQAHNAVNKVAVVEGRDNASVAWDHYTQAQGGIACGRRYRVRLATVPTLAPNRYGETGGETITGIAYGETYRDGIWANRPRTVVVDSKRYTWEIENGARAASGRVVAKASFTLTCAATAAGHTDLGIEGIDLSGGWLEGEEYQEWAAKHPDAARSWVLGLKRTQFASWTCVNNCTEGAKNERGNGRRVGSTRGETAGARTARRDIEALESGKAGGREVSWAGRAASVGSRKHLTH